MFPNHFHVLLFLIFSVISRNSILGAGEEQEGQESKVNPVDESKVYPVDESKYNTAKEHCKNVPAFGGSDENSTWSNHLTPEEIYELAFVNMGYGLTADAIAHLPIDLGWRKVLIYQIAYITKITCNHPRISSMYLSGVKNLFLYYMIKYEKTLLKANVAANITLWKAEEHQEQWKEILNALSKCAAEVQPINFPVECGGIDSYYDSKGMIQPLIFVAEQFDEECGTDEGYKGDEVEKVDIIIDAIWWMFSATYARCYVHFYPNEDIILIFLQRFREDVISFFTERWKGAGELVSLFEIIFGPISALEQHDNLRKCATNAYAYEGLTERTLVRPLNVMAEGMLVRNFKIKDSDGDNGGTGNGDSVEYGRR